MCPLPGKSASAVSPPQYTPGDSLSKLAEL